MKGPPRCFFDDCPYPDKAIDMDLSALVRWEVQGWVKKRRTGGGIHHIELHEYTGRVAHAECVERTARGLAGQQSLL